MKNVNLLDICDVYQPQTIATKYFVSDGQYTVYGANGAIGQYNKYNHEDSEVLMGCRGACGVINISKPFSWINGNAMVIKPKKDEVLHKDYLSYCLQAIDISKVITGTAQPQITRNNLKKLQIPVTNIKEQELIVEKIEELFSELDNAVETLNATKAQLKLYKQAVLKSAFSRCIEFKKAEDLCFFITKGTTPKKAEFQLEDKSIPFIKVYNLTFDGSLDFTIEPTFIAKSIHETSLARSIVYPGDVLMNIVGPPMGKVSIVPSSYDEWNINQAIARFRCKEELNNRYLAYFLMSSETVEKMSKQTKATVGQFNLTLETCRNIDIPVCSINEQLRIVDNLDTQLTAYNNIEKTVNDALQQATAMRQSILKQAFEGRLI